MFRPRHGDEIYANGFFDPVKSFTFSVKFGETEKGKARAQFRFLCGVGEGSPMDTRSRCLAGGSLRDENPQAEGKEERSQSSVNEPGWFRKVH